MIDSWVLVLVYAIPSTIYLYSIIRFRIHLWLPLLLSLSIFSLYIFITLFHPDIFLAREIARKVLLFSGGILTMMALDALYVIGGVKCND